MTDRAAVLAALDAVIDPKSGQGLATAGLVQGLVVADGRAGFVMEVPASETALYAPVRDAAEAILKAMPGMERVSVVLTAEAVAAAPRRTAGLSKAATDQGRPKAPVPTDRPAHVKRVLAVASGKGGVGKSTVAVNLAAALAARGLSVGVLDADVYGPSLPTMLGLSGQPAYEDGAMVPHTAHGLKAMSVGLLTRAEDAMIWRGPMASQAITQMLTQTRWGTQEQPLDVLVIDLPPGTGDVQLTMLQKFKPAGAVIVSTPQDLALMDATRAVELFEKSGVPVVGVVENMAGYACPHCGEVSDPFGVGGAEAAARDMGQAFLGRIPLDIAIRRESDAGRPPAAGDGPQAEAFAALAAQVSDWLESH